MNAPEECEWKIPAMCLKRASDACAAIVMAADRRGGVGLRAILSAQDIEVLAEHIGLAQAEVLDMVRSVFASHVRAGRYDDRTLEAVLGLLESLSRERIRPEPL